MDTTQRQLMKKYVDLLVGKWWLIAASVLVAVTTGLFYYLSLPKMYQGKALLSYEQQQINPARMDPEQGRSRLREALPTLQELVTSRTNLEKIITQLSLYEEMRKSLPIDDVIVAMRKNIEIKPAVQGDIFNVSFQGMDPEQVVRVTNALASLFIEENLKYREERATETSKYTESELAMAKKVMDEKEQVMRDYKLKHFNEMPEQRPSNLSQLQSLVAQNQAVQNSIQELERTKVMVQEQIGLQQRIASQRSTGESRQGGGSATARQTESNSERLMRLRGHLNSLQIKYTENHPEVIRTKQLIEELEKQGVRGGLGPQRSVSSAPSGSNLAASMEAQRLQIQIKEIDSNIKQLREEQAGIPAQIVKYQGWIDAAPVREAEWNALTRDYNELRRHYDQLVAQNLQAQSAENLERNQKGSKFKIVDSARLPTKPFSPNFLRILLVSLAVGLGVALGSVLVLDFVDTSFKDIGELEEYIGVPVVCAIPYIEKEDEARKDKLVFRLSVAVASVCGVALMAAIALMWRVGVIIV